MKKLTKNTFKTLVILGLISIFATSCHKKTDDPAPQQVSVNPIDTTGMGTGVTDDGNYYVNYKEYGSKDSMLTVISIGDSYTNTSNITATFSSNEYYTSLSGANFNLYLTTNNKTRFNSFVTDSLGKKVITRNKTVPNKLVTTYGSIDFVSTINAGELFDYAENTVTKVSYIKGTNDIIVEGTSLEMKKKKVSNSGGNYILYIKRTITYRLKLTLV